MAPSVGGDEREHGRIDRQAAEGKKTYDCDDASGRKHIGSRSCGKERDAETGLDNFGARYMSSPLGRFTSPDPIAGNRSNPQSLNRYAYALNNPLKFVDPTGMIVEWADSDAECEEGETECKTSAQRKYENELRRLSNSKNEKEQKSGKALSDTYKSLQDSKAVFRVVNESTDGSSRGMIGFDGSAFTIAMKGDPSSYGALSNNQKLAHEFEHGRQILDGELSFFNNNGTWIPFAYDNTDEAKAFFVGFSIEPLNPQQQQNSFLRGLNQALTGNDPYRTGAEYLGVTGPYRGRPVTPTNVEIMSPSIYKVPR